MQLTAFSSLLLEWNTLALQGDGERFHAQCLERLSAHLPFDSAWWGVGHLHGNVPQVVRGHLFRLPDRFAQDWQAIAALDDLARAIAQTPDLPIHWAGDPRDPDLFDQRYGIASTLSCASRSDHSGFGRFISLYRGHGRQAFSPEEQACAALLFKHLFWAEECCDRVAWHKQLAPQAGLCALVRPSAWLEHAPQAFWQALMAEFKGWNGGPLPRPLQTLVRQGHGHWCGHSIEVHAHPGPAEQCRLELRPRSRVRLGPREEAVARAYANGLSYKQIAKDMGLTPATVRSYLQRCYVKLSVSNKVALGRELQQG